MSGLLGVFDPDSTDEETRRLSRLAQGCWSPLMIVYDPLKAGSIDSTDTVPHDKAIIRAQNADFAPDKRIKGRPECTVFVGNLNATTSERSLRDEFIRYGRVVKATVVEDIITGRSRGYGFVEFSLEGEAAKAYEYAHRSWLDGNKIIVDMECSRLLPGWVPRRFGGGFNGRKESGQLRFGCRERPFRKPIKLLTEKEIKSVLEKTRGRKWSGQVKGNTEPVADIMAGESSNISESTKYNKKFDSPDECQISDVGGESGRPRKDRESSKSRRDEEIRSRERERRRYSSDSDDQSRGRESKRHKRDSKQDEKKKKTRRRNRSQSYSSDEERKHKHKHKRIKEHSNDYL